MFNTGNKNKQVWEPSPASKLEQQDSSDLQIKINKPRQSQKAIKLKL